MTTPIIVNGDILKLYSTNNTYLGQIKVDSTGNLVLIGDGSNYVYIGDGVSISKVVFEVPNSEILFSGLGVITSTSGLGINSQIIQQYSTSGSTYILSTDSVSNTQKILFASNSTPFHQITSNANSGQLNIHAGASGNGHYISLSTDGSERVRVKSDGIRFYNNACDMRSDTGFRLLTASGGSAQSIRTLGLQVSDSYGGTIPSNGILFSTDTTLTRTGATELTLNGNLKANQFVSLVTTGTAPFIVSSTTVVSNLNADILDGYHGDAHMRYTGWVSNPGYDANTIPENRSGFSYANNAPYSGTLVHIASGGYGLQFSSSYSSSGLGLAYRTKNGDTPAWNPWYTIIHSGNISSNTFPPSAHTHGSITNDGKIGTVANLVVMTGASGILTAKTAGSSGQFLAHDGSWATPSGTYSHPTGDGNLHVPATSTNNNGKFLKAGPTAGSLTWDTPTDTNTTYTFASGTTNGAFNVTPSGGTVQSVAIYGLGSAAYTASTAYLASTHAASGVTTTKISNWDTAYGWGDYIQRLGAVTTSGVTNWDDTTNARPGSGYTLLRGNDANGPNATTNYYHSFSLEYGTKSATGNLTQFAIPYVSGFIYYRTKYSGSWNAWNVLWSSENFTITEINQWRSIFTSQTANKFWASPNGSSGSPTFRTIAAADLPSHSLTSSHTITGQTTGHFLKVISGPGNTFGFVAHGLSAADVSAEPAISKSTGYLRYTGSAWEFKNETYSLSSHSHTYTDNFTINVGTHGTVRINAQENQYGDSIYSLYLLDPIDYSSYVPTFTTSVDSNSHIVYTFNKHTSSEIVYANGLYMTLGGTLDVKSGGVTKFSFATNGDFTAAKLIKSGGTSSQFLKADGSVDTTTYSISSHTHSTYVLIAGDTMTGTLANTKAWNATTGAGQIYLNGANGNRIDWSTAGVAAPTMSTTRSAGTKLLLYPCANSLWLDYAIGISGNTLWQSVPLISDKFMWYASDGVGGDPTVKPILGLESTILKIYGTDGYAHLEFKSINGTIKNTSTNGGLLFSTLGTGNFDINYDNSCTGSLNFYGGGTRTKFKVAYNAITTIGNAIDHSGSYSTNRLIVHGAGYFYGDVLFMQSDIRLKDNLKTLSYATEKVNKLTGYEFDWNEKANRTGHDVGLIAQDLKEVLPEAVYENPDGYLGIKLERVIPLLVQALKEANARIDKLEGING